MTLRFCIEHLKKKLKIKYKISAYMDTKFEVNDFVNSLNEIVQLATNCSHLKMQ